MTKQIGQTIILSAIILFTSCGMSEQQIKEEKEKIVEQKIEKLQTTNEKAISDLIHKYNAASGWDSLRTYTCVLQEKFIDEKIPIGFMGELEDITKSDSTYLLKVYGTSWYYYREYIALISIPQDKFIELKKLLKSNNHSNEGCFIFRVSKIIHVSPKIISEIEFDGENPYLYTDYHFYETLMIFKGDLIDFYLNETYNNNNE